MIQMVVLLVQSLPVKPERPESIWPISVFAWVTGLFAVVSLIITLRKANNQPIFDKFQELNDKLDREIAAIKLSNSNEYGRLERDLTQKINGVGRRVNETKEIVTGLTEEVGQNTVDMVRSIEDRKQLNARVVAFEGKMETSISMIQGVERSLRDKMESDRLANARAMTEQTNVLLKAMSEMITSATKKVITREQ